MTSSPHKVAPCAAARWPRLLDLCLQSHATDLHLAAGQPPYLRCHGQLIRQTGEPSVAESEILAFAALAIGQAGIDQWRETGAADGALSHGGGRFRVNFFRECGRSALALRLLQTHIPEIGSLQLPPAVEKVASLPHGLVIVAGATGSGKSTTLAALIREINHSRACHILTIEQPIEYLYPSVCSLVRQREVGSDTNSFADGLREALREDPDVILVGEIRDLATARAALAAAETGHLVLTTLHGGTIAGAMERLLCLFPGDEAAAVSRQLADCLEAVLIQRLIAVEDLDSATRRRLPVCELLLATNGVRNLVRTAQINQLPTLIETGRDAGMCTESAHLASHVAAGRITADEARKHSRNLATLETLLRQTMPSRTR